MGKRKYWGEEEILLPSPKFTSVDILYEDSRRRIIRLTAENDPDVRYSYTVKNNEELVYFRGTHEPLGRFHVLRMENNTDNPRNLLLLRELFFLMEIDLYNRGVRKISTYATAPAVKILIKKFGFISGDILRGDLLLKVARKAARRMRVERRKPINNGGRKTRVNSFYLVKYLSDPIKE